MMFEAAPIEFLTSGSKYIINWVTCWLIENYYVNHCAMMRCKIIDVKRKHTA